MHSPAVVAALAAWIPLVALVSRAKGPRLGVLVAILGGFVVLPRSTGVPAIAPPFGFLTVDKRTVSGLATLVAILVSDPRALLRARPRWLDLPMVAFVLLPLASLAANHFVDYRYSLSQVWDNFAAWSLPYLAGRLYFADREGPRRLADAVVVAGLASIPIYAAEMLLGPRYYLAGLVYGIPPHEHMVARLGGWRPEGFQTNGIEAASWLALSATTATWLASRGAPALRGLPAWVAAVALIATTLAGRGVYGYAILGLGLATSALSRASGTRAFVVALVLIPPAYMGARIAGAWDGRQLVELAARAGKAETVAYRLRAEDSYIKKVFDHGPVVGFGGEDSSIFDYYAQRHLWPDGWWIHPLRSGGVLGLVAFSVALFLLPAGLALSLPAGRPGQATPGGLAWGLALFLLLHWFDSLQNMALLNATPLMGGGLVGLFLARRSVGTRDPVPGPAGPPVATRPPTPLLVAIAVLLLAEALGRWPRDRPIPAPDEPNLENASPKTHP